MRQPLLTFLRRGLCAAACLLALPGAQALSGAGVSPSSNSWTLALENDFLGGSHRDADYTGGFLFTLSGPDASRAWVSLDPILGAIDSLWLPNRGSDPASKAGLQFGLQAWTPNDTATKAIVRDDRPYASLLSLTSTRMTVGSDSEPAYASSFTIGVLGAGFAKDIHKGFHKLVGSGKSPQGYSHQISDGGEPTLRYTLRRQALLGDGKLAGMRTDFKWAVEGSVGYLTEAALMVSGRIGRYSTPWWSLYPERTEFYTPHGAAGDLYLSYGITGKLRGYNALLEGQFRDSDVTVRRSNLETVIGEAWFGVTWGITNSATLTYLMRYQTQEIEKGTGARDYGSGGIYFNYGY
jgi:hypothetical protein